MFGASTTLFTFSFDSPANQLEELDTRAPVVRTTRGRTQLLPSRFKDFILEQLKKCNSKGLKRIDTTKLNMVSERRNRITIPKSLPRSFESADIDSMPSIIPKERTTSGVPVKGLHPLEEFDLGDIVWVKSGRRGDPAWPAKVIDPIQEAPDAVLSVCVSGRLCVMFFSHSSGKGKESFAYAWDSG